MFSLLGACSIVNGFPFLNFLFSLVVLYTFAGLYKREAPYIAFKHFVTSFTFGI